MKNNLQYDILHQLFSTRYNKGRQLYHIINFYDQEKVLKVKINFHSKLDFLTHQLQKQQFNLQYFDIFHLLEDDTMDIYMNALLVQILMCRNSNKININRDTLYYDR